MPIREIQIAIDRNMFELEFLRNIFDKILSGKNTSHMVLIRSSRLAKAEPLKGAQLVLLASID